MTVTSKRSDTPALVERSLFSRFTMLKRPCIRDFEIEFNPESRLVTRRLAAHGNELLCGGRMDTDGCVELGFGGAAVERYGEPLNDLSGIRPNHMAAQNTIGSPVDHELHHRTLVTACQRVP